MQTMKGWEQWKESEIEGNQDVKAQQTSTYHIFHTLNNQRYNFVTPRLKSVIAQESAAQTLRSGMEWCSHTFT